MKLEIDVGNTRLKWRYVDGSVIGRGSMSISDELSKIFEGVQIGKINSILVSSVASSDFKDELSALCGRCGLGNELVFVESESEMAGVKFAYSDISRLGVDRCLVMAAAYRRFPEGVLAIDGGSALTADFVDSTGAHLGGYILPGLSMLKSSLLGGTANVVVDKEQVVDVSPGANTAECVEHGRYFLSRSLIRGLIDQGEQLGINNIVITGGDGELLAELIGRVDAFDKDLLFEGLECVAG